MNKIFILCTAFILCSGAAFAEERANAWTKDEVTSVCLMRTKTDNGFRSCMQRSERKIGTPKQAGDRPMIDKAEARIKHKADEQKKAKQESESK